MSRSGLTETINKLKELCQCNICFNVPNRKIFNCPTGHSICQACYSRLNVCPQCEKAYKKEAGGCRNFDLEKVSKYFQQLNVSEEGNSSSTTNQGVELICPYKDDGCTKFDPGRRNSSETSNSDKIKALLEHTRECEYRPIECVVPTPPFWRYNTTHEKKRFCGPSDKQRHWEESLNQTTPMGWVRFESRSTTKEIPWKDYIQHLQNDHEASFCFETDPRNGSVFRKTDGTFQDIINDPDTTWAPHLFEWDGKTFVRQQWIHRNQIQSRLFVMAEPFDTIKYMATITVTKADGNKKTPILIKKSLNVLPIRSYCHELLKVDLDNPRHDFLAIDIPFAEENFRMKREKDKRSPTFAWDISIDMCLKMNINPIPFNNIPTDGERLMMRNLSLKF